MLRAFLSCIVLSAIALGSAHAADGALRGSVPVVLAAWDSLAHPERVLERADYERERSRPGCALQKIRYESDGREVVALVATPRRREPRPRPVVVFCRGSFVVDDVAWEYAPLFANLVERGFVVVAPLLRGSAGADGRDEMGGADVHDVLAVVPLLANLPGCDPRRIFLYGESRGGMMVFRALREHFPARAAATYGAFTDLDSLIASDPEHVGAMARSVWPEFEQNHAELSASRSALRWAEELGAPLLLMHGGGDGSVPVAHSERLAARLEALEKPYRLAVFGGEGHVLKRVAAERDRLVADWFSRYMND